MVLVLLLVFALSARLSDSALTPDYYNRTCPGVASIVSGVVRQKRDATIRTIGSTIRLFFHDCFVEGCDASVLIQSTPGNPTEMDADDNKSLAFEGYDTVRGAKAAVEAACPDQVSCADILALAAEISVQLSGGPGWSVLLGRLDGKTTDFNGAQNLPGPFDGLPMLKRKFRDVGLDDTTDLVALSGGHTFGRVQCQFVTGRLYNFSNTNMPDPTLDSRYRAFLSQRCPRNGPAASLNDLDPTTPDAFDNHYFTNLEVNRGFLQSDQELKSDPGALTTTAPIVDRFASSQEAFFRSFALSMIKMGNIQPLTDPSKGEVRAHCARVNAS